MVSPFGQVEVSGPELAGQAGRGESVSGSE